MVCNATTCYLTCHAIYLFSTWGKKYDSNAQYLFMIVLCVVWMWRGVKDKHLNCIIILNLGNHFVHSHDPFLQTCQVLSGLQSSQRAPLRMSSSKVITKCGHAVETLTVHALQTVETLTVHALQTVETLTVHALQTNKSSTRSHSAQVVISQLK